ncbi:alpha/beta hydrolase [Yinghuangia sp. ASG 101]|uniref:alpha/beta hydrolase n=1 Tax=Yinghuangia sp. ASG 101 TaxID=2896848 RepID=UPI001E3081D3|nr:alpha/beta hydrolase [Yinghuangia sp. ASG 101]UGQ12608.1 alpha/beta hydrolase [Yinghuangia sp. ASG 101]
MSYAFDPELAAAIALMPDVPLDDLPAVRAMQAVFGAGPASASGASDVTFTDAMAPGPAGAPDVLLRVYRPADAPDEPLPAVYDIHGGGFILGSVEVSHEGTLEMCRALGAVVASVDYRLAPEDPYPAGVEDCYAGLAWFAAEADRFGVDPARIVLHGASAGGGLAAGTALLARDRGGPSVLFQYLAMPELDDRLDTPSMRAFTDTPVWDRGKAAISWDAYLGPGRRGGADVPVYAAPARATDLRGLPPAYISVMEFDPLRDEGIAYAQALLGAGVSTELHLLPGTFHGSQMVRDAAVTRREKAERVAVLRRVLHG